MDIPLVDFITCYTRKEENLDAIANSILKSNISNFRWFICSEKEYNYNKIPNIWIKTDSLKNNFGQGINYYLDSIKDTGQWVYILDDDNLVHSNFHSLFNKLNNDCKLAVFSQQLDYSNVRVANPYKLWVQYVDSAQFCISRQFIGGLRMWNVYRHDGYFLMELVIRAKEQNVKYQVFQEVFSYYNAQLWLKNSASQP